MMRFYRALLWLYPAGFRLEYGDNLAELHAARAARHTGPFRVLRIAFDTITDVVPSAIAVHVEILGADVRHTLRVVRRSPAYFGGILAVLALGIGANGAVFSILHAVLLRPLPYKDPAGIVMLWERTSVVDSQLTRSQRIEMQHRVLTSAAVIAWREQTRDVFADLAAMRSGSGNTDAQFDLELADRTERLQGAHVTPNFFEVLGTTAEHGRLFTAADEAAGTPLVVISHGLWQRAYGADPSVVGRSITLSGGRPRSSRTYVLAGVLQKDFRFTYPNVTDVYALESWPELARYPAGGIAFWTVARLKPGVTLGAAQARASTLRDPGDAAMPAGAPRKSFTHAESIREWVVGNARPSLLLLGGVAVLLLLITCATVANAMFVRFSAIRRELAVRAALGAHTSRLRRALATQGALIAVCGTIVGTALALAISPLLRSLVPASFPRGDEIGVSLWVLAFAAGAATVTMLLATMAPAWRMSRMSPSTSLRRTSGATSGDRTTVRWRASLVGVQSAIATALLIGAVLLTVSFWRLHRVPLGFDARDVLTVEMRLLGEAYRSEERVAVLQDEIMRAVRAVPGVAEAGMTSAVPFRGTDFLGRGVTRVRDSTAASAHIRYVDSAFFSVMRVGLVHGRVFAAGDSPGAEKVAVISEQLATELFGTASPLGEVVKWDEIFTIVGVVRDMRYKSFEQAPRAALYLARSQSPNGLMCLVVRTAPGALGVAEGIRAAIHRVDPAIPAMRMTTIDQILDESVSARRFYTVATGAFAIVAVALTIVGVALVVSRAVLERQGELAIRSALGATSRRLVRLILRSGVAPVAAGVVVGVVGAIAAGRVVGAFLFGIPSRDPMIHVLVAVTIITAGALAALIPAKRVFDMETAEVLRAE